MKIILNKSGVVLTAALTLGVFTPCHAEIYKCVENGKTTFSQYPCSSQSEKYTPTTNQAKIPGLSGGTCLMTMAGSDEGEERYAPTKGCLTANSAKDVDEGCMQLQGLMSLMSSLTGEALDSRNSVTRGTDCDSGAFAKCTYQKESTEFIEYSYPRKNTDMNKMIENRIKYCKERNGVFSKL